LTKIPLPDIQLTAGGLHLQLDGGELTLSDAERGHRLVVMPVAGLKGRNICAPCWPEQFFGKTTQVNLREKNIERNRAS
jgi:hypothetical protein